MEQPSRTLLFNYLRSKIYEEETKVSAGELNRDCTFLWILTNAFTHNLYPCAIGEYDNGLSFFEMKKFKKKELTKIIYYVENDILHVDDKHNREKIIFDIKGIYDFTYMWNELYGELYGLISSNYDPPLLHSRICRQISFYHKAIHNMSKYMFNCYTKDFIHKDRVTYTGIRAFIAEDINIIAKYWSAWVIILKDRDLRKLDLPKPPKNYEQKIPYIAFLCYYLEKAI